MLKAILQALFGGQLPLHNNALFRVLRRMRTQGKEFFHDGEWTAIRLVEFSEATEERLANSFRRLLAEYGRRGKSSQMGYLLIWAAHVSLNESVDSDRFYLVVTLEGHCPTNVQEFDRLFLEVD